MGGLFDCIVFYYVKDLDLYSEPDEVNKDISKTGERNDKSQENGKKPI